MARDGENMNPSDGEKKPSLWERLNQPIGKSAKKDAGTARGASAAAGGAGKRTTDDAFSRGRGMSGTSAGSTSAGSDLDKTEIRRPVTGGAGASGASGAWNPAAGQGAADGAAGTGAGANGPAQPGGPDGPAGPKGPRPPFGKGHGDSGLPSKRTMNLYQPAGGQTDGKKAAIVAVCLAAGIVLFIHFGIQGPYAEVAAKQQELSDVEAQLEPMRQSISDYDDVLKQYQDYTPASSASGVDATAVLQLVDDHVRNNATLTHVRLEDTTVTIDIANTTLKEAGEITADVASHQDLGVKTASVKLADGTNPASGLTDQSIVTAEITVEMNGSSSDGSGSGSSSSSSDSSSSGSGSSSGSTSSSTN